MRILKGIVAICLAAVALLLIQLASVTTDLNTAITIAALYNKSNSNALLGNLFLTGEDRLTNFNRINETYTVITYLGNRTIMPPEGAVINATETGNLTFKLHSNGITFVEGESILTKAGFDGNNSNAGQQENATAMLVDLNGIRPYDPRSSTDVAFFSTNPTGQLAFLDNLVAIYQVRASPAGTAIAYWEWKGADLPTTSDTVLRGSNLLG